MGVSRPHPKPKANWRFGHSPKANDFAALTAGWLMWEDGGSYGGKLPEQQSL